MRKESASISDEDPWLSLSATYSCPISARVLNFVNLWLTFVLICMSNYPYYHYMFNHLWMFVFLPISIYGLIWEVCIISAFFAWIFWKIVCIFEPPKEGHFPIPGREFKFYLIRFWVCYYAIYIARAMPLPWVDMYLYRAFGAKIGNNVVLYDSWIDIELIEIRHSTMVSLNTQLFSHFIFRDRFIAKKITIEESGIAGATSIVAPGTIIEEGAVLGATCSTHLNQRLTAHCIHVGNPVNLALPIKIKLDQDETS